MSLSIHDMIVVYNFDIPVKYTDLYVVIYLPYIRIYKTTMQVLYCVDSPIMPGTQKMISAGRFRHRFIIYYLSGLGMLINAIILSTTVLL